MKSFYEWYRSTDHKFIKLIFGMAVDLWRHRYGYRRRVHGTAWRSIPSVSKSRIEVGVWNVLTEIFGFKRRMPSKHYFSVFPETKRANKYMRYQVQRLINLSESDPRKFWKVAILLIRKSKSFRLSALNFVLERWYREMSIAQVLKINRKVKQIIRENKDELDYRRTYIPKTETSWRPLGVPTPEWRVVLHMYNNMLSIFLRNKISKRQHGFQPMKGTLSAWKDLLGKIHKYKYVYEIDLKGCFPNIAANKITTLLKQEGTPPAVYYWLENINRSIPKFPKKDGKETYLVDESIVTDKRDTALAVKEGRKQSEDSSMMKTFLAMTPEDQAVVKLMAAEDGCESIEEFIQLQWALLEQFSKPDKQEQNVGNSHTGLAQGAPTSPLLTIFAINKFVNQCEDSVFYADDGIFLSNKPIELEDWPEEGIKIHPEKSGYIVENGVILRECKFLGLTYNLENGKLRASTRKGSKLEVNTKIFWMVEMASEILQKKFWAPRSLFNWGNSIPKIFEWGISGYLIAALYTGRYDLSNTVEELLLKPGSWVSLYSNNHKRAWSTNSSKACRWLLKRI